MRGGRRSWGLRGMTPLIDLLFLMLFALLALSESRRTTQAETVRVRLPHVEPQREGREEAAARKIVLEIDGRSRVRLEGRGAPLPDAERLDAAMAPLLGDRLPEEVVVEIRGDAAARHGVAVALLQHLRRRGFAAVHLLALGDEQASWGGGGAR